ncbi:hypothetical protein ACFX11_014545 [Malus domestica]
MEVVDREKKKKINDIDEGEDHYASVSASKSQFRKVILKARWSDEMGMAEVVDKRVQFGGPRELFVVASSISSLRKFCFGLK